MSNYKYPHHRALGVSDESYVPFLGDPTDNPQLVPYFLLPTEKGQPGRVQISSSLVTNYYGDGLYKKNSPFNTHIAKGMEALTGTFIIERMIPDDAKEAGVTYFADVIETDIPVFARDEDLKYVIPLTKTGTTKGYSVKFISETGIYRDVKDGCREIDGAKSVMYPLFSYLGNHGSYYNNLGFSLFSPDDRYDELTSSLSYIFVAHNINKGIIKSLSNVIENRVSLENHAEDKYGIILDFNKVMDKFYNEDFNRGPIVATDTKVITYADNILSFSKMLLKREIKDINEDNIDKYDFTSIVNASKEPLLLDIISFKSQKSKIPYYGVMIDKDTAIIPDASVGRKVVEFSKGVYNHLEGGYDGTFDDVDLDNALISKLEEYTDPNSLLICPLSNSDTMLIDTGYGLETKLVFYKYIMMRINTHFILSNVINNVSLDQEQRNAIAAAVNARHKSVLESVYYNTAAFRGIVVNGTDENGIPGSIIKAKLLLDIAGRTNRVWAKTKIPMLNAALPIKRPIPSTLSISDKITLTELNCNYMETMGGNQYKFHSSQTIYPEAKSTLNNTLAMIAMCDIQTQLAKTWAKFSGDQITPKETLFQNMTSYLLSLIDSGHYTTSFVISVVIGQNEDDIKRGNRWTTNVTIATPSQLTIMTSTITAKQLEEVVTI